MISDRIIEIRAKVSNAEWGASSQIGRDDERVAAFLGLDPERWRLVGTEDPNDFTDCRILVLRKR